MIKTVFMYFCV